MNLGFSTLGQSLETILWLLGFGGTIGGVLWKYFTPKVFKIVRTEIKEERELTEKELAQVSAGCARDFTTITANVAQIESKIETSATAITARIDDLFKELMRDRP